MFKNVGGLDRIVRIIAGIAILSLAFVGPKTAWAYLGLIPLVTGLIGFCPLYSIVGLRTCPAKKESA